MKYLLFVSSLALLFAITGCRKEITERPVVEVVFSAGIDGVSDTKTTIDAGKVKWAKNDEISVNGVRYIVASIVSSDSTKATFTKHSGETKPAPSGPFHAFYPSGIQSGSGNAGTLPSVQTYNPAGISNLPMYASSSTEVLNFKNICGVLKITVKRSEFTTVKSIRVSSPDRALSGAFTITDGQTASLTSSSDVTKTVTLSCPDAVTTTESGTVFYIAIPAQKYAGLKIEVSSDGTTYARAMMTKSPTGMTISANKIYPISYCTNAVRLWAGGPYWATVNIGATISTYEGKSGYGSGNVGDYYCWGGFNPTPSAADSLYNVCEDIQGKWFTIFNLPSVPAEETQDRGNAKHGDVARYKWGSNWCMPRMEDLDSLLNKWYDKTAEDIKDINPPLTQWSWCKSGEYATGCTIPGWKVSGKNNYASSSIFLPVSGYQYDSGGRTISGQGTNGYYWTSAALASPNSWCLSLTSSVYERKAEDRSQGYPIRAICR